MRVVIFLRVSVMSLLSVSSVSGCDRLVMLSVVCVDLRVGCQGYDGYGVERD